MGLKGSQKFAVFLCKFSDNSNVEPYTPDFYRQLIAERGTGGLNDYWIAASQGAINLDGSDIFGWRTIQQKQADFLAARPGRWRRAAAMNCARLARSFSAFPLFRSIS